MYNNIRSINTHIHTCICIRDKYDCIGKCRSLFTHVQSGTDARGSNVLPITLHVDRYIGVITSRNSIIRRSRGIRSQGHLCHNITHTKYPTYFVIFLYKSTRHNIWLYLWKYVLGNLRIVGQT